MEATPFCSFTLRLSDSQADTANGALGVRVLLSKLVQAQPRILNTEPFSTPIPSPWGSLGPGAPAVELRSELTQPIQIRYRTTTALSADDSTRERVGGCELAVREVTLRPD